MANLNLEFLERLTNAFGPSANEEEAQALVFQQSSQYADQILSDRTGSLILKRGTAGPKIMLAGHIDEIGYLVSQVEKKGFLRIVNLGGVFTGVLIGHEIVIKPFSGGEKIIGIVQMNMFNRKKESKGFKALGELFVDIGCSSDKEVEALGIRVGDFAVPRADFRMFERTRIKKNKNDKNGEKPEEGEKVKLAVAKAFDDRIGVFIAMETLRRLKEENVPHPNQVYFVSTTQEELGTRGARTSANLIQPDIGIALDVTISKDIPGAKGHPQKMGKGPVIMMYDRSMVANPKFRKFIINTAEEANIKHQDGLLTFGGTDAGIISLTGSGAPSIFLGIATRYVHSHHSMLDLGDVEKTVNLLIEMIKKLDEATVNSFTSIH